MKLSFLPWSHSRRVELWRNSPLALPAWPLRLTGPNRVVEGELRSCCWLDPGALFTETRQAGKTGVAGSPSPLTLGPVDLISPGSAGAIWRGPGEPEMSCTTHVTLRGQHGLAWFIKPGAVPPCCLIIAPRAYPKSTPPPSQPYFPVPSQQMAAPVLSICPSLISSFVHSIDND